MDLQAYLEKQLERVDKWLTFAEAKNAALIAFNAALLQVLDPSRINNRIVCTIYILAILLSTGAALLSFIPLAKFPDRVPEKLKKLFNKIEEISFWKKKQTRTKTKHKRNLIFWDDIANFPSAMEYLKAVNKTYFGKEETSEIAEDFAIEVWENSGIASRKYKWFKIALYIDLSLVVMLGFLAVIA